MDALNAPVMRRTRKEIHSSDTPINQRDDIDTTDSIDHENIVVADSTVLDGARMLAFMEEPMTIMLQKSAEKYAPIVVDCWVNGIGAEVFMNGKWTSLGFLPVGREIITKRKYVEVLARSKVDNISTNVVRAEESERNLVSVGTSANAPFSVLEDRSPFGREWLSRIMREQS